MGIVNVTPDSFSDGGQYADIDQAVAHAKNLVRDGAAIIDVGGESTRPYAQPVRSDEELRRVIPVIERLRGQVNVPISIDTCKASVARAAIEAGAEIINDVSGLEADPQMLELAQQSRVGVCIMHMQGTPQSMQDKPTYANVVEDILRYLEQRLQQVVAAGIDPANVCLDPGIGFGKTHQHNLTLIAQAAQFHQLGCPVLIGHSRKGFISKLMGSDNLADRDAGTLAISILLAQQRVQILRVHNVELIHKGLALVQAVSGALPT
jgi:dihydropteroate synthase